MYKVDVKILAAVISLYDCPPRFCVCIGVTKSKFVEVGVGLRKWCVLTHFSFIIFMNWIDMRSRGEDSVPIETVDKP